MPEDTAWQDVAKVLASRWQAGPGNKGWEREQLDDFIAELQEDKMTPHWAVSGLRASGSAFIPSVGEVRTLAREAMGPPTIAQIQAAEERMRLRAAASTEQRYLAVVDEPCAECDDDGCPACAA
jgi:hypothetical protein